MRTDSIDSGTDAGTGQFDVSVVIPIRNGARYIEGCISFLKAQTYQDFEAIFVVDTRSDDGSLEKVRELAEQLPRSTVIPQDQGKRLGGNRNIGLEASSGEYIWFLDVDDAPSPYFIEEMRRLMIENPVDFVCCNFLNTNETGTIREKPGRTYRTKVLERDQALIARNDEVFPVSSWCKMFSRSFLVDNGLLFEESFAEDVVHTYRCVDACTRICLYDRPLYAYRQTRGSICRGDLDARGLSEIKSYDEVDDICTDPVILRKNAIMKIRSSGHMSYRGFMEFTKSERNRASYEKYLKGSFEGWWNIHISSLYWLAIRTYVALVYKRNGSYAMKKLK